LYFHDYNSDNGPPLTNHTIWPV